MKTLKPAFCNYGFENITPVDHSTDLHVQMPHYISKSYSELKVKVLLRILSPEFEDRNSKYISSSSHADAPSCIARCCIFCRFQLEHQSSD
jgi:hypothetical protein